MSINSRSFLVGHLGSPTIGITFKSCVQLILTTSKFCSLIALVTSRDLNRDPVYIDSTFDNQNMKK